MVGGNFYRGSDAPELKGMYLFAGAATPAGGPGGRLFAATPSGSGLWPMAELLIDGTGRLDRVVKGFGQDTRGEVYVVGSRILGPTGTTGTVWKIVRLSR